jgi:hypothetical protein
MLRDIQHHLVSTIGTVLSHETISKITDQVGEEVLAWQRRPLEALYPVIYLDALWSRSKTPLTCAKAAHIAVGVDLDGIKHVLGIWAQTSEGAKFWAGMCAELAKTCSTCPTGSSASSTAWWYRLRRSIGGNARNGMKRSHAFSNTATVWGFLRPNSEALNASSSIRAASASAAW